MDKRTDMMMGLQGARMVNVLANGHMAHMRPVVQELLGDADLFLTPGYADDDDSEDGLELEERVV